MSAVTYGRFELLRVLRNRQGFIFSLIFPTIMYFILAAPNRHDHNFGGDAKHPTGLFAPQYYMVGLLAFGAMVAVLSTGPRISAERVIGWNRQLRLTPLSTRSYLRVKVITGYLLAVISMALLYVLGISLGVRLSFGSWVEMTALILVALIPFAVLGIAAGHLLNDDAAGPALGGGVSLFALLGGSYFPITGSGVFVHICQLLPSFWLVQAGHIGLGAHKPWGVEAWAVLAVWSLVAALVAAWAYKRDTRRAGA
ncbi:MAG TPA: ABC transporter permease [Jatrophihabitantaceae bacterium]|jgi:ABC-2 type transport system permease protein